MSSPNVTSLKSSLSKVLSIVRDWPFVALLLLALGFISVAQHVYQTFSVLLQTFIIPGISVSVSLFLLGHFLNVPLD